MIFEGKAVSLRFFSKHFTLSSTKPNYEELELSFI
jgi:hypothetical protein